ncbi:hypothetical protein HPB51_008021 [Rhipicephalus microplus]|uniref:Uncharacterized protein n=1 Tax=Rhipicephalus microplus TaxID=6941 RepID=A0A9J6EFB5_RHIMP|nr:hypothetical protein HPB51_008021 [Rhipicephalus microplus]
MSSCLPCKRQLAGFGPLLALPGLAATGFCRHGAQRVLLHPVRSHTGVSQGAHSLLSRLLPAVLRLTRSARAPLLLDQTSLAYDVVETLDSVRGGIYQLRALCPNSSSGCSVLAFLLELKEHFAGLCDFI